MNSIDDAQRSKPWDDDDLRVAVESFQQLVAEVRENGAAPRPASNLELDWALDEFSTARAALAERVEHVGRHGWPERPPMPDTLVELAAYREQLRADLKERVHYRAEFCAYQRQLGLDPYPMLAQLDHNQAVVQHGLDLVSAHYEEVRDRLVGELVAYRLRRDPNVDIEAVVIEERNRREDELDDLHDNLVAFAGKIATEAPQLRLRPGPKPSKYDRSLLRARIANFVVDYRGKHDGDDPAPSEVALGLQRRPQPFSRLLRAHRDELLDPALNWPPESWWTKTTGKKGGQNVVRNSVQNSVR